MNLVGLYHLVSSKVFIYHFRDVSIGRSNLRKLANNLEIEKRYLNHTYNIRKHLERFRDFETVVSSEIAALGYLTLLIDTQTLIGRPTGSYVA